MDPRPLTLQDRLPLLVQALIAAPGTAEGWQRFFALLFEAQDPHLLAALTPHLHGAFHLPRCLADSEQTTARLAAVLDDLPSAVAVLSGRSRVLLANRSAKTLLARRDGLTLERGRLCAEARACTLTLRRMVAATSQARGQKAAESTICRIARRSSRRPYIVMVGPLPAGRTSIDHSGQNTVLVTIVDPEQPITTTTADLEAAHDLTPAEAKVALMLLRGHTVEQAARLLSVNIYTVRSHLRGIFNKTQTSRQAELMRLLMRAELCRFPKRMARAQP